MKYELTKDLETGSVIIDNEHRELIKAVNDLLDACSGGKGRDHMSKTIKFLNDYVDRHFAHEEQLQQRYNYPEIAPHKAFHEKYKQTLREITSEMSADKPSVGELSKLNVHIGLLITHIRTEDKKLGAFLNKA
ncbi:MAG: bacteriohemerythrin [Oscillospiraceae bacterium]|nr:bacteriohemerythrin [Oscillospiraceae bacterium]